MSVIKSNDFQLTQFVNENDVLEKVLLYSLLINSPDDVERHGRHE